MTLADQSDREEPQAKCRHCGHTGHAEDFPLGYTDARGGDWETCPECGSSEVYLIDEGRPEAHPTIEAARDNLRTYSSIGAAASNLGDEVGCTEQTARKYIARAIRADIAHRYALDADEVDRVVRLAVTKR